MSSHRLCCCGATQGPTCAPCECAVNIYSVKWTGSVTLSPTNTCPFDECGVPATTFSTYSAHTRAHGNAVVMLNSSLVFCSAANQTPYSPVTLTRTDYFACNATTIPGVTIDTALRYTLSKPQQNHPEPCNWIVGVAGPATYPFPAPPYCAPGFSDGQFVLLYKKQYDPASLCAPPGQLDFWKAVYVYTNPNTFEVVEVSANQGDVTLTAYLNWSVGTLVVT